MVQAEDLGDTQRQLRLLQQQNEALQEQLGRQQALIEALTKTVNEIQSATTQSSREMENLKTEVYATRSSRNSSASFGLNKVSISGEGGVAFFESGSQGSFPNGEFRLDEAKLFVEAPVWEDVYFFSELNLMTREASELSLQLGETYLDIENVSKLWNRDRLLNVRFGRMYIPFGEEYLSRYAIDNPLISHSLSDLWGVDAGIEFYGKWNKLSYVLAVQNGGDSGVRDYSGDKSVAGRLSLDPARWLHLSVSGMRTGDLKLPKDDWSALWFGNGWIVPIGSSNTTTYYANLVEGDVELRLPHGQLKAFGGYIRYDDNDSLANNRRDIYYYAVEGVHNVTRKLYGGVRFSQILAANGYPIVGNGNMGQYLYGPLTDELWRLSLGLGYRWNDNFITKAEYTFERGKQINGIKRNHEDFVAVEAAFKF
jgi:hypothetical protein